MSYKFDFSVIVDNMGDLFYGCLATLGLPITAMALALVIAVLAVMGLRLRPRWIGQPLPELPTSLDGVPFTVG